MSERVPNLNLTQRMRRRRATAPMRAMLSETQVRAEDLIAPLFIKEGLDAPEPIESMPGIFRLTPDQLVEECQALLACGVRAVALFPCTPPDRKDPTGTEALNLENLVLRTVRRLKRDVPEMLLITDVALDPYTSHGHDGILSEDGRDVLNDATVDMLARMAVLQAEAGVDWVAPSDMMDGRVGAIRQALDAAGQTQTSIMAYSAKYASAYYGPFRDAIGSRSAAGGAYLDKRTYQMNPANPRESIQDALLDEAEGADCLMVKPAGAYLDILSELRRRTLLPLAAYQVSGEYAQIHAAAERGWLDLRATRDEALLAIKRAGADLILTYFARAFAEDLRNAS